MENDFAHIEDQILVMDAQDGDAEAMDRLVVRWQKPLWKHAVRLTGDTQAAWDVTQQSWIGIIKGLDKLHDPASFKSWAYRITTNKCFDWIKKHKADNHLDIEDVPAVYITQDETCIGLIELMDKLDTDKKTVLCLHYFDQMTVAEIGAILKIPNGTVKSRLHKARRELKEIWKKNN